MSFVKCHRQNGLNSEFFLSFRTANFKNFGISSITSKRKMKWVIKVNFGSEKSITKCPKLFFSFSVPSRWKSDDNMLNTQNEAAYDINGHKVSRSGSARSFIRGGRKNSWVRNDNRNV